MFKGFTNIFERKIKLTSKEYEEKLKGSEADIKKRLLKELHADNEKTIKELQQGLITERKRYNQLENRYCNLIQQNDILKAKLRNKSKCEIDNTTSLAAEIFGEDG